MSKLYSDFQKWLRDNGWSTANSGRLGKYCLALNKSTNEIVIVENVGTEESPRFDVKQKDSYSNQTEAMNEYRSLCSLDTGIEDFLN